MLAKLGAKKVYWSNESACESGWKGIEILRNAGCEVIVDVLPEECAEINKRFFTFHRQKRPYVILKWAETADGFLDSSRNIEDQQALMSGQKAAVWTHQLASKPPFLLEQKLPLRMTRNLPLDMLMVIIH